MPIDGEPVCGVTNDVRALSHRCECIRTLGHYTSGQQPTHLCRCGTQWTDEVELEEGRTIQMTRFDSRAAFQDPVPPPMFDIAGPRDTDDYTFYDSGTGGWVVINDITEVLFAPQHVVFSREGVPIYARAGELVRELKVIDRNGTR